MLVYGPGAEGAVLGSLGSSALDEEGIAAAQVAVREPAPSPGSIGLPGPGGKEIRVFIEIHHPADGMVVVGAGHIAQPLARMGALLGMEVTILDDRPEWARRDRFPDASKVLQVDFDDPFRDTTIHPRSHVVLVTRGHRYDYECLVRLLRMDPPPAYIGMIGSRRRVRATFAQLGADGFGPDVAARVWAPIGLDIGAQTPTEIAVAVAGEIILARRGGTGTPLRDRERVADRFMASDAERVGSGDGEGS
jgi:xanthine dehydrogenase accessory factor